ncbi:ABC transporter permease [Hathewaya histolytica]|uniref:ABC transporter permease n=1 Tax=Hathewaya histolytica TaxID=1498 RepID=UPI003B671665
MRQLSRLIIIELRTFFKIGISFFFSFLFPVMLMVIVMLSSENPMITENYYLINKYVVISFVIGLVPLSLVSFPISVASDFEYGVIERFTLFNIKPSKVFLSKFIVNIFFVILQFFFICLFATIFKFKFPPIGILTKFFMIYLFTSLSLFLLGWILAYILKRVSKVQVVGMSLMFVFLAFSGAFGEFNNLPGYFKYINFFIPTYDLTNNLTSFWLGQSVNILSIVLKYSVFNGILLIISVVISRNKKLIISK